MKITTNNVPRDLIGSDDLTEKEREEFDYVDFDEPTFERFFRYKGNVYDTQDCENISLNQDNFGGWDGVFSESFFSGVVFKYAPNTDYEQVIVGRYCT